MHRDTVALAYEELASAGMVESTVGRGTFVRAGEEALAKGDAKAAQDALKAAQPEIVRGANKRVLHKRAAARKVSRLTRRVKALSK